MKRHSSWLRAMLALFLGMLVLTAVGARAGNDTGYKTMANPMPTSTPGKIEVIEFFSFGCPHCAHYEPYVEAWAARLPSDVAFVRDPVNFPGRTDWAPFARLGITLKAMGKLNVMAQSVFNAVHQQGIELRDPSVLFPWIAGHGLDVNQFKAIWNGFGMSAQMSESEQQVNDYHIDGVPEFVVNGKYLVQVQAGDEDGKKLFATINRLIARERTRRR